MTLNGHFTLNFHCYEERFQSNYFCILTVENIYRIFFVVSREQERCAEADRDPQNISDPRKNCTVVDEKLRELYRRNLNK